MDQELVQKFFIKNEAELINWMKECRLLVTTPSKQEQLRDLISNEFQAILEHCQKYIQNDQFLLFFWQWITNFITANQKNQEFILDKFNNQTIIDRLIACEDQRIVKTIYVFIFNMLKQGNSKELLLVHSQFSHLILCRLQQFYQDNNANNPQIEWITYIMCEIFNSNTILQCSYLEQLMVNQNTVIQMNILLFMFHMMQKSVDERQFPTLIHDLQPLNYEFAEMYNNQGTKLGIQLCILDLSYLIKLLKINTTNSEYVLLLYKLFCIITFLGGYNPSIQGLLQTEVFEHSLLCLESIHSGVQPQLEQPNELVTILLRFISNMVHLNKSAWDYFLGNTKYIPIVLGFNVVNEFQHKEWSTIIIRNLCDNEQLRDYINQL